MRVHPVAMSSEPLNTTLPTRPGALPREARDTPSVLTPADIREFQRLVRDHCGVSLTDVEAWNRATALVAMYRMMLRPIPEDPGVGRSSDIGRLPSLPPGKVP